MALQDKKFIQMNVVNGKQFAKAIDAAIKQVGDLRFAFGEISRDFYKSERAIFKLKSPGGYPDLSTKPTHGAWEPNKKLRNALQTGGYKAWKQAKYGFTYPILRATGKLEKSITSPNAEGSINIIGKKGLVIGTAIPYANFHNSDDPRTKIPQRKFVFIGPESRQFAKSKTVGGRLVRWNNIIDRYVRAVLAQKGFGK